MSFAVSFDVCLGEGSEIQGGCRAGCRLRRRRMDEGSQIQGEMGGLSGLRCRLMCRVSSDVCMGEGLQIEKNLWGRVLCDVCIGEGSQIQEVAVGQDAV